MLCAGAILAGGQSTRMGQPKEGVVMPDGRRMIEPLIETLMRICRPVVVVGACRGFPISQESGIVHLQDTDPGAGPLAAIRTLLKSGIDPHGYIITACDQPFVTPALLNLLIPSDTPRILQYEAIPTPFPGYYPVSWLDTLEKAFIQGERSLCALLQTGALASVPFPKEWAGYLKNINTPAELP